MDYTELRGFDIVPYPFRVYVCLSTEEWDDIKTSVEATHENWTSGGAACCRTVPNGVIISIDYKEQEDESEHRLVGQVIHECVHAFQALCDLIGEDDPSSEFEAYTIQHMSVVLLGECLARRTEDAENDAKRTENLASGTQ